MSQFASADDFAARIGVTLTDAEVARANLLLTRASGIIQKAMKQNIALVTDDTYVRPGDYSSAVRLPERPVVSVSSVVLDDNQGNPTTLVQAENFYIENDTLIRLNWNAVIQDSSFGLPWAGWGFPWWTLTVDYTHGYTEIPEPAPTICMEMVVRAWVNPGSVARQTIGNVATVFDNMRFSPSGMLLTDQEQADLADVFRRHTGTVGLR